MSCINNKKFFTQLFFLCLAVLFILYLRTPDRFSNPQLWAEDGKIFFAQAQQGFLSTLITPYAGYLHTLLRIAAGFASLFDSLYVPTIYLIFSILYAFILCYSILRAFENYSLLVKIFLCLSIGFVFGKNFEVFNNLTNSQWYCGCALFLSMLWQKKTKITSICDNLIIFLLGLTGPFSVIYVPMYFLRAYFFKFKDVRQPWNYYLAWIIPALIQIIFLLRTEKAKDIPNFSTLFEQINHLIISNKSTVLFYCCMLFFCFYKKSNTNTKKDTFLLLKWENP